MAQAISGWPFSVSTQGRIYGLSVDRGRVVWSTQAGTAISGPHEQFGPQQPVTGFGAGQGLLVVPAGNELAAYSS